MCGDRQLEAEERAAALERQRLRMVCAVSTLLETQYTCAVRDPKGSYIVASSMHHCLAVGEAAALIKENSPCPAFELMLTGMGMHTCVYEQEALALEAALAEQKNKKKAKKLDNG